MSLHFAEEGQDADLSSILAAEGDNFPLVIF